MKGTLGGVSETHLQFPIRSDKLSMTAKIGNTVLHQRSEFQTIDILDSEVFGKMLLLDGHIQLTEFDEHAYHEALVQIPLLSIAQPKKALVVGGGDGGVLRELCKNAQLERIVMVEIDRAVVDASRQYLPSLSDGAFEDERVDLQITDAFAFVKASTEEFDLIVVDCTDVYEEEEGELSEMLFTQEFYRDCLKCLSEKGILVTQADNLVFCPYSLEEIRSLFASVFPHVGSYQAIVPSFGGFSGYCWASRGAAPKTDWNALQTNGIDLRYLNPQTHALAFTDLRFR